MMCEYGRIREEIQSHFKLDLRYNTKSYVTFRYMQLTLLLPFLSFVLSDVIPLGGGDQRHLLYKKSWKKFQQHRRRLETK